MSLENAMQTMRNNTINDINSKQAAIYQALVEDSRENINRIPEDIFVNYFLPFFLGERGDNSNWLMEWVSIAGSPSAEVAVINNQGVLFYVPPVFNSSLNAGEGDVSFKDIFTRYEMYNNNLPQQGLKFLVSELGKKIDGLQGGTVTEQQKGFYRQWDHILVRYGRKADTNVVVNVVDNSDVDDLMDY